MSDGFTQALYFIFHRRPVVEGARPPQKLVWPNNHIFKAEMVRINRRKVTQNTILKDQENEIS